MIDHVVVDVEIQKTIKETPGGWDADAVALLRRTFEKRLALLPDLPGCHIWLGALSSTGYGSIRFKQKCYSTHVIAFFLKHGRFPAQGLVARHVCDTRLCCRDDHLLEGTKKDNSQDAVTRGRHGSLTHPELVRRGQSHHHGRKTHCPHGHPYTPENTYIINDGQSRACVQCAKERARIFKQKKRGENHVR